MRRRPFGTTGLTVTPLGMGLAALGRPGYINLAHAGDLAGQTTRAALEAHCHRVLDAAYAAGIRYMDAARSYGSAEAFVQSWLATRPLDPAAVPTIGSKWGYTYTAGWRRDAAVHEVKDHSAAALRRQWQETQTHLGGVLRLYQIHSATLETGVLSDAEVIGELARLRDAGIVIGLSVSGPQQAQTIRHALAVEADGQPLFQSVQATWNLLERAAESALKEAHEAGRGVLIKEALANGRLTPRNTAPDFAARLALLQSQAQRLGTTVDAVAVAAALAQPWADCVLLGAATVEQLRSNVKAVEVRWDEEGAAALAGLVEAPTGYWETRRGLAWN